MEAFLGISVALGMAVVHFLGEELEEWLQEWKTRVISFGAGVSITYIFMILIPEFSRVIGSSSMYIYPLAGFSLVHLVEKYEAKETGRGLLKKRYSEIHAALLLFYHGTVGYLISFLISENFYSGMLFVLPIFIHLASSSLSISELHEDMMQRTGVKLSMSLAPVAGSLIYFMDLIKFQMFLPVFGLALGTLTYVSVRDSIPHGEEGRPLEYVAGASLYVLVVMMI